MRALRALSSFGRPHAPIASFDATGGTAEANGLLDDGVPKVLLRIERSGVIVEMALARHEAAKLRNSLTDRIAWVEQGGKDE